MKCTYCRTQKSTLIYKAGSHEIVKCAKCGLVRTDNFDFDYKYDDYHRDLKEYQKYEKEFENIFRKRFEILNKRFNKPGKVLEIGCSTGTMLKLFKDAGWETEGIEPSKNAAKLARKQGIKIHSVYFEKASLKQQTYDLVILNHTFEHMSDPVRALNKLHKLLRKNGLLYIDVPNFDSHDSMLNRANWAYLIPCEHVYHFTPQTLQMVVKNAGFDVLWWDSWSGVFDVADPFQKFKFQLINRPKSFVMDLLRLPFNIFNSLVNKGTSVAIIARK